MVLIQTDIDQGTEELVVRVPDRDNKAQLEEFRTPVYPDTEDLELVRRVQIFSDQTDGWVVDSEVSCMIRRNKKGKIKVDPDGSD